MAARRALRTRYRSELEALEDAAGAAIPPGARIVTRPLYPQAARRVEHYAAEQTDAAVLEAASPLLEDHDRIAGTFVVLRARELDGPIAATGHLAEIPVVIAAAWPDDDVEAPATRRQNLAATA